MFVKCEHFATLARTQPFNVTVSTNALMLMVSLLGLSFRHFLFSFSFWSLLLILLCRSVPCAYGDPVMIIFYALSILFFLLFLSCQFLLILPVSAVALLCLW